MYLFQNIRLIYFITLFVFGLSVSCFNRECVHEKSNFIYELSKFDTLEYKGKKSVFLYNPEIEILTRVNDSICLFRLKDVYVQYKNDLELKIDFQQYVRNLLSSQIELNGSIPLHKFRYDYSIGHLVDSLGFESFLDIYFDREDNLYKLNKSINKESEIYSILYHCFKEEYVFYYNQRVDKFFIKKLKQ